MHCEKNFAENVLKTVIGEKDSIKVRQDMQRQKIKPHLSLTPDPANPGKMLKPFTPYVITPKELDTFCTRLESVKVPSEYCSNMGSCIRNRKFGALKSHDYHALIHTLLPMALRGLMEDGPRMAIMRSAEYLGIYVARLMTHGN